MITINDLNKSENFFLMAGPCVIEGEDMALRIADKIVGITERLHIPYVFKGSYRKANRSRLDSFTGIGDEKALKILRKVGETFNIPTVTDIHETTEAAMAAEYVDVLQIPAPMPPNGFIGSGGRDREDRQYKERTVPFAGCHAIRRTKGSGRRK